MPIVDRTYNEVDPITSQAVGEAKPLSAYFGKSMIVLLGDPGIGKSNTFDKAAREEPNAVVLTVGEFLYRPITPLRGKTLYLDGLDEKRSSSLDGRTILTRIAGNIDSLGRPHVASGAADNATYTYDANGNLASKTVTSGTTTYTWDARDRLGAISGPGITASFKYDALGRRFEKTVNGKTTTYLYDGIDIIQEQEGGAVKANYLRTLNVDEVLARTDSSGIQYYHHDHLGSTVALTDENGITKTVYSYDPFGNTTQSGEATEQSFQYTGRENDGTGLYYYRARYYSPETERFISKDPIFFAGGGSNLYGYLNNSPTDEIDPSGLAPIDLSAETIEFNDQQIQDAAEFATAFADAASLGTGPIARDLLRLNGYVDECSAAYKWGNYASIGLGLARIGYMGAAKALPYVIRSGATHMERALAISSARNMLKRGFWLNFVSFMEKTTAQVIGKYVTPDAIINAATRTNPGVNACGMNNVIGGGVNAATSCGCK